MKLRSTLRRGALFAVALALSGFVAAQPRGPARGTAPAAAAMVNGLIVELRDAPTHVELARERAQARGAAAPAAAREGGRWQRLENDLRADAALVREVPALAQAPRRDPVGARAQVLRFARPLTPDQAARVAERLAAQPDVAWVEPNVRERRQAIASGPPSDQYFPGTDGQWWLQPVQGSNTSTIDTRLRGVPGFLTAWTYGTTGAPTAVIAVLDTGTTLHPELTGRFLPGYDFVSDWDPVTQRGYANDGDGRDADASDPGDWVDAADRSADPVRYGDCEVEVSSWHGTVIAGMLAGVTNNGAGGAAMNWDGRVLPVRVAGKCGADVADIVDGMRWAAGLSACKTSDGAGGCAEFAPTNPNPARIVNISFGGSAACGTAYQQAIDDLRAAPGGGAVVVAAAGNGWGAPSRPANCQRVIGVGALNRDGFKTNYSNFGAALAIATIGGDDDDGAWGSLLADSGILTIGNGGLTSPENCLLPGKNCYYYHFGTSFSAPVVAGAVSLMLSLNPALTADQIVAGLARSARSHVTSTVPGFDVCGDANPGRCLCTTSTCGAGILDVDQALRFAANPGGYVNTLRAEMIDTAELREAVRLGPDRPANPAPPSSNGSSGGGGAMSAGWLLALALAAWALRRDVSATPRLPRKARSPSRALRR
jgi:serine protease